MDDKKVNMSQSGHLKKKKRCMIHTVVALRNHPRYHRHPSYPPKSVSRPYPLQLQPSLQMTMEIRDLGHDDAMLYG